VGLGQPNLVRWLDYGLHGTGPYVVHELSDAQQARTVIGQRRDLRQPFAPAEVARIGLDLTRALIALHHGGLIHAALNETTVFLSPSGAARLLPLGLETPWYYGAGAYRFLSPEQATGTPPGPASDLFQLGTLLYTLLLGEHPFAQDTESDTIDAILGRGREPPPLPARTPAPLRELIERLIAVDPAARPAGAEELLMELAMRSGLSMTPPAEPPPRPYTDWIARAWELARVLSVWAPLADRGD
jgi:eukaryotic-like serine/threonine-protein kinase